MIEFYIAVVTVVVLSQALQTHHCFSLSSARSFTKVSGFMLFPCLVQVIVYFF